MKTSWSHDEYLEYLQSLPPTLPTVLDTLAHDVRNRMTLVLGYCEFIYDKDTHNFSDAEIKELAEKIKQYSQHVINIVDAANQFAAKQPKEGDAQG